MKALELTKQPRNTNTQHNIQHNIQHNAINVD
jgi:hypothetical protein